MFSVFQTFAGDSRFDPIRSRITFGVTDMPKWARGVLLVAMVPGILLVVLSIFILLVSILALLLFTVPVYQLLKWVTGVGAGSVAATAGGTKRVRATVTDA